MLMKSVPNSQEAKVSARAARGVDCALSGEVDSELKDALLPLLEAKEECLEIDDPDLYEPGVVKEG